MSTRFDHLGFAIQLRFEPIPQLDGRRYYRAYLSRPSAELVHVTAPSNDYRTARSWAMRWARDHAPPQGPRSSPACRRRAR